MKYTLLLLSLVGCAYSSTKLDLSFINKALTRIVDEELKALAGCMKDELLCDGVENYPSCLDSETETFNADVDVETFFILNIMKLKLSGTMKLMGAQFKGLSDFEITNVSSSVTVIPLGIEFKFTLAWKDSHKFISNYKFDNLYYMNTTNPLLFIGEGPMSVEFNNFNLHFVAHKLLGGDMDVLRIKPQINTLNVQFEQLCIGGQNLTQYTTQKFNDEFVNTKLDFKLLEDYVMKFFNDALYPTKSDSRKLRAEKDILTKLGDCIFNKFPQ